MNRSGRFTGYRNRQSGQFFQRADRKQQHTFDGAEGADGEIWQQQIIPPVSTIFEGRGGTQVDLAVCQQSVESSGRSSNDQIAGRYLTGVAEKGNAIEVVNMADPESHDRE